MGTPNIHVRSAAGLSCLARDDTEFIGSVVTTRGARARLAVVPSVALARCYQRAVTSAAETLAVTSQHHAARAAGLECSLSGRAREGTRFLDARSIGRVDKGPRAPTFAIEHTDWLATLGKRCLTAEEVRIHRCDQRRDRSGRACLSYSFRVRLYSLCVHRDVC